MRLIKVKKGKCKYSGRPQFIYKCDDGLWRTVMELAPLSKLKNGTTRRKSVIIRNRIKKHGFDNPHILGPETPKGKNFDGSPVKHPGPRCKQGRPNWEGIPDDLRPMTLRKNGEFDDKYYTAKPAGVGGAKRYLGY